MPPSRSAAAPRGWPSMSSSSHRPTGAERVRFLSMLNQGWQNERCPSGLRWFDLGQLHLSLFCLCHTRQIYDPFAWTPPEQELAWAANSSHSPATMIPSFVLDNPCRQEVIRTPAFQSAILSRRGLRVISVERRQRGEDSDAIHQGPPPALSARVGAAGHSHFFLCRCRLYQDWLSYQNTRCTGILISRCDGGHLASVSAEGLAPFCPAESATAGVMRRLPVTETQVRSIVVDRGPSWQVSLCFSLFCSILWQQLNRPVYGSQRKALDYG